MRLFVTNITMEKHVNIELRIQSGAITRLLLFIFTIFNLCQPLPANAVQWNKLAQTKHHNVAIEMDSLHKKNDGNIAIWLRFTPRDARQRKEAAAEYTNKNYFQHLEYYEINCIEQSAALRQIDILDKNGKRIERLTDFNSTDTIIPGSVLDMAATAICPESESFSLDDSFMQDSSLATNNENNSDLLSLEEKKLQIKEAIIKTESEPANSKVWAELGNAYYDLEMPEDAIKAYNMSLKLNPNDIEVLNDQGAMFRLTGNFQRAIKNHELVLAIDPNNLESLYSIGYIYAIEVNRTNEAIPFWKRFLAIDSSSETANQIRQYLDKYGK